LNLERWRGKICKVEAPLQPRKCSPLTLIMVAPACALVVDRHGDMDVGQDNVAIAFGNPIGMRHGCRPFG
jgi:hypothetical protein